MPSTRLRSVLWTNNGLQLIDQRKLPAELVLLQCHSVDDVTRAIADMAVRGAPAIGAAGAFGLALGANDFVATHKARGAGAIADLLHAVDEAKATIDAARPTAVNLTWGTSN